MIHFPKTMAAACALVLAGTVANAVGVTGYDIQNTPSSGSGGWGHSYDGTITADGSVWDYSGGTGTMANGVIETTPQTTHLFQNQFSPSITFFLDAAATLSELRIFGGAFGGSNSIPGAIVGVDVTLNGSTASVLTTEFGAVGNSGQGVNDRIDLVAAGLSGIATTSVILSNFLVDGNYGTDYFSIAEFEAVGSDAPVVPLPATLPLLASVLGVGGWIARRRR